jgi:hypothetical protein
MTSLECPPGQTRAGGDAESPQWPVPYDMHGVSTGAVSSTHAPTVAQPPRPRVCLCQVEPKDVLCVNRAKAQGH